VILGTPFHGKGPAQRETSWGGYVMEGRRLLAIETEFIPALERGLEILDPDDVEFRQWVERALSQNRLMQMALRGPQQAVPVEGRRRVVGEPSRSVGGREFGRLRAV
jgi:hypothetical protein